MQFSTPLMSISQIFARRVSNGIHHRVPHRLQPMASRISAAILNIRKQQNLIKKRSNPSPRPAPSLPRQRRNFRNIKKTQRISQKSTWEGKSSLAVNPAKWTSSNVTRAEIEKHRASEWQIVKPAMIVDDRKNNILTQNRARSPQKAFNPLREVLGVSTNVTFGIRNENNVNRSEQNGFFTNAFFSSKSNQEENRWILWNDTSNVCARDVRWICQTKLSLNVAKIFPSLVRLPRRGRGEGS